MRNIEKGLLLATYFDIDCSDRLPSFISYIKEGEAYKTFIQNKEILKNKKNFKAKKIYSYYKIIDFDHISSFEQGMVLYGKMLYLLRISKEEYYSNPLLVAYLENEDMTIGDFHLDYNAKIITLDDLALLTDGSFNEKKLALDKLFSSWTNEVYNQVLRPIEEFKKRLYYFPKRFIFNSFRIIELVFILGSLISWLIMFFTKIYHYGGGYSTFLNYIFYLIISFTSLYLITYVVVILTKRKEYKYYIKARKIVLEDASELELKIEQKLYNYILESVSKRKKMTRKVYEFNTISSYYSEISFFSNILRKKRIIKKDRVTYFEIGFLVINIVLWIILGILFILH